MALVYITTFEALERFGRLERGQVSELTRPPQVLLLTDHRRFSFIPQLGVLGSLQSKLQR